MLARGFSVNENSFVEIYFIIRYYTEAVRDLLNMEIR